MIELASIAFVIGGTCVLHVSFCAGLVSYESAVILSPRGALGFK